ncbi:MAG: 50S ribosomal protein L9 [bacterium]|nr:50S ribosomal protein L9 [bacterium]
MRVILKQDVERLGKAGDIVTVKDGYARNFLFPRGLAMIDTPANQKTLQHVFKRSWKIKDEKQRKIAMKAISEWGHIEVSVKMRVGEDGKMFGAVTSSDIAELVKEQRGIEIDRRKLLLEEPIRSIGTHQVHLKLHSDVHTIIHVNVVPILEENEELSKEQDSSTSESSSDNSEEI